MIFLQQFKQKNLILSYEKIMEYISNEYEPMRDLKLLLKYNKLNNKDQYNVWLFENKCEKYIDINGGNIIEKYIPKRIIGKQVVGGYWICYPSDYNYLIKRHDS